MRRSNCALMSTMNDGFTSAYRLEYRIFCRPVRLGVLVELLQPGQEAGLEAHLAAAVMIGMARLPVGQNHHARLAARGSSRPASCAPSMVFSRRASGMCRLPRQRSSMCFAGDLGFRDALLRACRACPCRRRSGRARRCDTRPPPCGSACRRRSAPHRRDGRQSPERRGSCARRQFLQKFLHIHPVLECLHAR